MLGLRRVGVACIVLAVLVPMVAIWGPPVIYRVRSLVHFPGSNILHFGILYSQQIQLSIVVSMILMVFGVFFMRDTARREKDEKNNEGG